MSRRLIATRRRVEAARQAEYDGAWARAAAAAQALRAHAWRFRAAPDPALHLEFLEFAAGADPRADPALQGALQQLEALGAGMVEEWEESNGAV